VRARFKGKCLILYWRSPLGSSSDMLIRHQSLWESLAGSQRGRSAGGCAENVPQKKREHSYNSRSMQARRAVSQELLTIFFEGSRSYTRRNRTNRKIRLPSRHADKNYCPSGLSSWMAPFLKAVLVSSSLAHRNCSGPGKPRLQSGELCVRAVRRDVGLQD